MRLVIYGKLWTYRSLLERNLNFDPGIPARATESASRLIFQGLDRNSLRRPATTSVLDDPRWTIVPGCNLHLPGTRMNQSAIRICPKHLVAAFSTIVYIFGAAEELLGISSLSKFVVGVVQVKKEEIKGSWALAIFRRDGWLSFFSGTMHLFTWSKTVGVKINFVFFFYWVKKINFVFVFIYGKWVSWDKS